MKVTGDEVLLCNKDYPNLGIERGANLYEVLDILDNKFLAPIDFIVGDGKPNSPNDGDTAYNNTALVNKNFSVIRNGMGKMHYGVHCVKLDTGGFKLIIPNDVFSQGEQFSIIFY